MKKLLIILISIFSFAGVAFALPYYSSTQTMIPFVDNSYDIGTSSKAYRNLYVNSFNLSGTAINSILSTDVNGNIVATSTPTFGYFNATSTTATSTIAGNVKVSGNLEVIGVSLLSIVSSGAFTSTGLITGTSFTATSNTASVFPYASTTQIGSTGSAYFATSGGNVGIGTTTPAWLTQIAGTRPSLALSDTSSGTNLKHFLLSNNGGNLYIGTSTDAYATSTPSALTILNNGNIGVGTAAPGYKLDVFSGSGASAFQVSGTSTLSPSFTSSGGDMIVLLDAPATLYASGIKYRSGGNERWQLGRGVGNGDENFNLYNHGTASTNLSVQYTSGNVGIGDISPDYLLDVAGTLGVDGETTLTYASTTQIGSTGSAYFATSGGNVGIGTITPSNLLNVYSKLNNTTAARIRIDNNNNTGTAAGSSFVASEGIGTSDVGLYYLNSGLATSGTNVASGGVLVTGTGATGGLTIRTNANAPIMFATNWIANERM